MSCIATWPTRPTDPAEVEVGRARLRVANTITEVRGQLVEQRKGKTASARRSLNLDPATVSVLRRWRTHQTQSRRWPRWA